MQPPVEPPPPTDDIAPAEPDSEPDGDARARDLVEDVRALEVDPPPPTR